MMELFKKITRLTVVLFCAAASLTGLAAEPQLGVAHADSSPTKIISLNGEDIIFDGTHQLDWVEAESNDEDPLTIPSERWIRTNKAPNVNGGERIVWYRMRFQNDLGTSTRYSFMSLDGVLSNVVKLKTVRADHSATELVTGTALPRSARPVASHLLVLPMDFQSEEVLTAYFGIQSSNSRNLFYHVRSDKSLLRFELGHMSFFGFYLGMLFFVALTHFLAGFVVKDRLSYYYSSFVVAAGLVAFFSNGFFHFLMPASWILPGEKIDASAVPFLMAVFSLFSKKFLETDKWSRLAGYFFDFSFACCVLMFTAAILGINESGAANVQDLFIKIVSIGSLGIAIYAAWRKATTFAVTYMFGFSLYLFGANLWTMQFTMENPSSWYSCYSVFGYQLLQNVVFSIAVMMNVRRGLVVTAKERATVHYGERMSMFVRVLTHDLSNYITTIDGSLMILARPNTTEEVKVRSVERAKKAIDQQKEVLDSIKELKAVEDGKAEMNLEVVDINTMLQDLMATFETRLATKNLHLEIQDAKNIKVWAHRKTLFHSVICNLISNAIKFSHANGTIKVVVHSNIVGSVVIQVVDSGIGMPKELVTKIFSDGEQTSRTGTGGEKGTGFGLPICKAYMTLYEGSISVTSKEKEKFPKDHGTTFSLEFKQAA